jgi:hypothetical protein
LDAFAWAALMLDHLLGVQVSEEIVRRLTEQAGAWVAVAQTHELRNEMVQNSWAIWAIA